MSSTPQLMMELIAKHTLQDEDTFELMASIIVGVCPDESQQFTPLRVILQVENNEVWNRKKDLASRREVMAVLSHNLALDIKKRFFESNREKDIDIAIALHRKSLEITPKTHKAFPLYITSLAKAVLARYDNVTKTGADLDLVISLHRTLLAALLFPSPSRPPVDDDDYASYLSNLADVLGKRYNLTHNLEDLDEAIEIRKEVIELSPPPPDVDHIDALRILAQNLTIRHRRVKDVESLDTVISLSRAACAFGMLNDSKEVNEAAHTRYLRELATAVCSRYRLLHQEKDLQESIELYEKLLQNQPVEEQGTSLTVLSLLLDNRFDRSGNPEDLERAISVLLQLLARRPFPHPERYNTLINLGSSLRTQFVESGQKKHLDNAETFLREAIELLPADLEKTRDSRATALNNLSTVLLARYEECGIREDLREAMRLQMEALKLESSSEEGFLSSLSNLVVAQFSAYEIPMDARQVLSSYQPSSSIEDLASKPTLEEEQDEIEVDLNVTIGLCEEALENAISTNPHYPAILNNLGNILRLRFQSNMRFEDKRESAKADLQRGIQLLEQSVAILEERYPQSSQFSTGCLNLGIAFFQKAVISEDDDAAASQYRDAGAASFKKGVTNAYAPTSTKFMIAKTWAAQAEYYGHPTALEAFRYGISLLPLLAVLNADLELRQQRLMGGARGASNENLRTDGLAIRAAGCAIRAGKLEEAIELLEEGRAVFWTQAMQVRSPMHDLEAEYPDMAEKLRKLGRDLEVGSFGSGNRTNGIRPSVGEEKNLLPAHAEATRLRRLNAEWEETLTAVRNFPKFEDFLRPHRFPVLQSACLEGGYLEGAGASVGKTIVILCATHKNTDALILTAKDIKHLPLSGLSFEQMLALVNLVHNVSTAGYRRDSSPQSEEVLSARLREVTRTLPGFEELFSTERVGKKVSASEEKKSPSPSAILRFVLKMLWLKIVEPVVKFLDLKASEVPSNLYWCPTGPLTFLPIHAAGLYDDSEKTTTIMDYAISSYIPTIGTLLQQRTSEQVGSGTDTADPFKMLVIVQPKALPSTLHELRAIQGHIPKDALVALGHPPSTPLATVSEVLRHLSTASIVHFACHGKQNLGNPLESALLLDNGGKLSVERIMQHDMRNAQLAFLCACETAMGEREVPDESMHLGAALLFAGFKGVVATMWSIADQDGPKVAGKFYEYISGALSGETSHEISIEDSARALHFAVQTLRLEGVPLQRWVPFIHLGK